MPDKDAGGQSETKHPENLNHRLLVTADEAAALLGISRAHFYRMHNAGRTPLPVRLGGSVRWRTDELRMWVAAGMPNRSRWTAMNPRTNGGAQ